jgi:hypothetical protein
LIIARTAQLPVALVFLALFLVSCQDRAEKLNENIHESLQPRTSHQTVKEKTIIVPPEVARRWQAVKLAVIDKTRGTENIYIIPVGTSHSTPSALTIQVEAFLPAFTMEGSTITTSSNELINPSAKVKITENGAPIFKGWLFLKYPNTHAVTHPKYGFSLVGVVPVVK